MVKVAYDDFNIVNMAYPAILKRTYTSTGPFIMPQPISYNPTWMSISTTWGTKI